MKYWKLSTVISIFAVIAFAITVIGCDNGAKETAHNHQWDDWTVKDDPTCTEEGLETRACLLDPFHIETKPIAPLGHDWGEWSEPTPTNAGITTDSIKTRNCEHDNSHIDSLIVEYATGTEGLKFTLINNNTAYKVEKGTITSNEIYIPNYHRPTANDEYLPVTEITVYAFDQYTNLTSITIPENVTMIGMAAFRGCTSLTSITIPANVTNNFDYPFFKSGIINITVNDSNPKYASENGILYNKEKTKIIAFPKTSGDITIPTGVTSIGSNVFIDPAIITGITIPESVITIDEWAFVDCSNVTEITIPASVRTIGRYAFESWISSQTINIKGYSSEALADEAWNATWRERCGATINYLGN
jgi:hypothetical protein